MPTVSHNTLDIDFAGFINIKGKALSEGQSARIEAGAVTSSNPVFFFRFAINRSHPKIGVAEKG
ncbi:MAG: hypothetical protein ACI4JY_09915 [Oscillospiraceae bacterium]